MKPPYEEAAHRHHQHHAKTQDNGERTTVLQRILTRKTQRNAHVRDGEGNPRDFLQKLGLVAGDRETQQTQSRRAEDYTEDDVSKWFGQIPPLLEPFREHP